MKDFYHILGIEADASFLQIREAYRSLSKKYHPDANQGDIRHEEKFKAVLEAYLALKDPAKRKLYTIRLQNFKQVSSPKPLAQTSRPAHRSNPRHLQKKASAQKNLRKDLYMGGGVLLFLLTAITVIVTLENSFKTRESYIHIAEPETKKVAGDSMNLIRGFIPSDSVAAKGKATGN